MKDFSLASLYAITQDILGWLFWPAVIAAAVITLLFIVALARRPASGICRGAIGLGILGAIVAAIAAPYLTQASFSNIHGAVDWASLVLVAIGAFVAVSITAFALLGLASKPA
jgi:hypothetical protein